MKKFWNWTTAKDETGLEARELTIDGEIAEESWFDDDVTPEIFRNELASGTGDVTVWINSPGGDCFAASRIYTMLRDYNGGKITVKVDGIAASAASVIAMAADELLMAPTAMLMIHNPATLAFGDSREMEKAIEMLNEVKESIINAYALKTAHSRVFISKLMDEETWMNAKKAIELGFADGMIERSGAAVNNAEAFAFGAKVSNDNLLRAVAKAIKEEQKEDGEPEGRTAENFKKRLETIKKTF